MADIPLPFEFPLPPEQLQGDAFQRLSPEERAILDVIGAGERWLAASPHREVIKRYRAEQEEEWRRIHKELFTRHGEREASTSAPEA